MPLEVLDAVRPGSYDVTRPSKQEETLFNPKILPVVSSRLTSIDQSWKANEPT